MQAEVAAGAQRQAAERAPRPTANAGSSTKEPSLREERSRESQAQQESRRELRARARRAREDEYEMESREATARLSDRDDARLSATASADTRVDSIGERGESSLNRDGDASSEATASAQNSYETGGDFESSPAMDVSGNATHADSISANDETSLTALAALENATAPAAEGAAGLARAGGSTGDSTGGDGTTTSANLAATMVGVSTLDQGFFARISDGASMTSTQSSTQVGGMAANPDGASIGATSDATNNETSPRTTNWTAVDQDLSGFSVADGSANVLDMADSTRARNSSEVAAQSGARDVATANDAVQRTLQDMERAFAKSANETHGSPVGASNTTLRAQDAVAGRLSEVESSIARARVVDAMESQEVRISMDADVDASESPMQGADGQRSAGAAMQSHGTSAASMSGFMGQGDAVGASGGLGAVSISGEGSGALAHAGLASDLAQSDGEIPVAARLAAKGAHVLANQRGGAITMRLEPPALGQLRIELRVAHGAVHADFTAATPEARVLIEANLGMLRERLESQGLSVDRMTVHGGNRPETTVTQTAQSGTDGRADADSRDRSGERASNTRHDAADGESRGRRDGEGTRDGSRHAAQQGAREERGTGASQRRGERNFAQMFGATLSNRSDAQGMKQHARTAEPSRRAG